MRANNRNIFVEVNSEGGDYVTGGVFNTSTGEVTLTRLSGGTVVYDLDGRYSLTGHTHPEYIDGLIVEQTGGSPSVSGVTKVVFSGATVIDDGGGQVTVQSSGGGGGSGSGITWTAVTSNTTCAFDTGYIANSGSLITFTLPETNDLKTIRVTGKGVGGWQVDVPSGWSIYFAGITVTDNLQSNDASDSIELLGLGDNEYQVISSIGNITFNNL